MATSRLTIGTKYHLAIFFAEAVIFTLLFFVFEGYQFGVGNQLVFLPVIDSLSKYPHLANDFGVSLCRFYHPFFNISMAWLSGFISPPLLFLLMQTLLVLIFHITLRRITLFFFDSPIIYWSAVILMFLWTQQGVDGNVLWTNRLEAQYLAWPWIISAFSAYLASHWLKAGIFTGLICLFHLPLGVITGIVLSVLSVIPISKTPDHKTIKFWAGSSILGLPIFFYSFKSIFSERFLIGPNFISAANLRMSHHMLFDFRLAALFVFLAFIPAGVLKIEKLRNTFTPSQINAIKKLVCLQIVLLLFGGIQYADYYLQIGFLSRLQFLRLFPFIYLTGVLFLTHLLLQLITRPKYVPKLIVCLLIFLIGPRLITYQSLRENWIYAFISLLAMGGSIFFKNRPLTNMGLIPLISFATLAFCARTVSLSPQTGFSFHPAPFLWDNAQQIQNPWVDVSIKARQIIPKNDLVLSPPDTNGFVYFSKHKTFVEFKTMGSHRKTYAEWFNRLDLSTGKDEILKNCSGANCLAKIKQAYNQLEPTQIDEIIRLYGATFFVTRSSKIYPYELLYTNGTYRLYRLILSTS